MSTIPSNSNFPTSKQVPDHSILDVSGKQVYLGNQFSLPVAGFSIATAAETNVALISNPVGSGKSLFIGIVRASAVSSPSQFKFYVNPTVTSSGTMKVPVNFRPAMSSVSVSACSTSPVTSANGTLLNTFECGSSNVVSNSTNLLMILDPGFSILVTCTPGATTLVSLNVGFWEL